jgi:hypothetical protein
VIGSYVAAQHVRVRRPRRRGLRPARIAERPPAELGAAARSQATGAGVAVLARQG